jgi:hypothetical protein
MSHRVRNSHAFLPEHRAGTGLDGWGRGSRLTGLSIGGHVDARVRGDPATLMTAFGKAGVDVLADDEAKPVKHSTNLRPLTFRTGS